MTVGNFLMYYQFSLYIISALNLIIITSHIISFIVLFEEVIKYCKVAHPGTVLYATGYIGILYFPLNALIIAFMGKLYDQKDKDWVLLGGLIYSSFAFIYAFCISLAESNIRNGKYYKQMENLRKS